MQTPTEPLIPLCRSLAENPDHYMFKAQLERLLETRADTDRCILLGMVYAYLEMGRLEGGLYLQLGGELCPSVWGHAV